MASAPCRLRRHTRETSEDVAAMPPVFQDNEVRIVIIGKTGNGKSSAANTILGQELCRQSRGMSSGTDRCDWHETFRRGLRIQVTDTPGVCDTHRSRAEVQREIVKCIATVTPGPHAVIMALRCDQRFTDEEYTAYQELKNLFGKQLTKYMILIFNGVDELRSEGRTLEMELRNIPPKLRQVLDEAEGRYVGFSNNSSWRDRTRQGDFLIDTVASIVKANGGRCFSNELVQKFEAKMKEEIENIGCPRSEIKQKIVEDKNSTFCGKLLHILSFGLIPKHVCAVM
ncbi:GTPase IMAP family member 4-like isoform X2 [Pomacea canaliculata]|uniref:GTPase IMAP family member 4-like isoform X2 n=1 Tax=Pomacea canaliculata TaxID=400727 RepID=UPI000D72CDAF|nr:GTPase IMAP family member 4-like isoform X2 [Pomacea canaliculata]